MANIIRFFKKAQGSYFLLGPRGTGKTLWTRTTYPDGLFIDLLDPETVRSLTAYPERLREFIDAAPNQSSIIIDEVQKIPELLDVIHQLIEEKRNLSFILTGSSARKLKRSGVNLLGGRANMHYMHPYMASELKSLFSLKTALERGMLPLVWGSSNSQETLKAYTALYLHEEVQMEGFVRNVGNFHRFLETMAFSHGCVLNLENISRDCEVKHPTVRNYLEILEDLLLAFRLPVFTKKAKRLLSAHPKFFYFDTGIFLYLRPKGPLDRVEEIGGAALEGLVAQHLRAWCDYSSGNHTLYYWQTRTKVEVDFIIYGESGIYAFEVKNTNKVRKQDQTGLIAFKKDYPQAQCFLLYRGDQRRKVNDILYIPCETFLRDLIPDILNP